MTHHGFYERLGGLAQLGEHLLCKQGVVGSIPSSSTISAGAPPGAEGRGGAMGKSQGVQRGDIGWDGIGHGVKYTAEHRRQFAATGLCVDLNGSATVLFVL